jgi:hypothetical protein
LAPNFRNLRDFLPARRFQLPDLGSQYEPAFALAAQRARKIRHRLGATGGLDAPFPEKPKAMHWKTYERLQLKAARWQNAWAVGAIRKFKLFERNEA